MRSIWFSLFLLMGACTNQDKPLEGETALVAERAKMVMNHVMQHDKQEYFDVIENGETQDQIVVIFDEGVASPNCDGPVTLIGREEPFSLGGKPGTRKSYAVRTLYVRTWRCL